MTTFDEREHAFENMYAHDAEMQFKAEARRNKLLGLWAAEKMGLTGEAAEAYARSVINEVLKKSAEKKLLRKVSDDLDDKGAHISEKELHRKMEQLMSQAKAQIVDEGNS